MAASSLRDVIETVTADDPDVTVVLAGSSTLVAQLAAGARADVLITADETAMQRAVDDGLIAGEPVAIATNSMVIATAPGNPGRVSGLEDLARAELLVGLCAVEVPCGALATRILGENAVTASVDSLENSVRALTTKLSLGELDAGLIYRTDAAAASLLTVDAAGLDGHVNRYLIAPVSTTPSPQVQALIDAFTEAQGAGARALSAHGFGPP